MTTQTYIDSRDITGKMSDIFQQTMSFILANIKYLQGEQGVNSPGVPEISRIVFEELLVNALVHRDYFISAPVRVFIFSDRIELINPGHLPNNLTWERGRDAGAPGYSKMGKLFKTCFLVFERLVTAYGGSRF